MGLRDIRNGDLPNNDYRWICEALVKQLDNAQTVADSRWRTMMIFLVFLVAMTFLTLYVAWNSYHNQVQLENKARKANELRRAREIEMQTMSAFVDAYSLGSIP